MTSSTTHSRLAALASLADEPCSERRRDLMREATDVFFAPDPPAPEVLALFEAAVEKLTSIVEVEMRVDLSQRLAPVSSAPRRLVCRLISDEEATVAAPLLSYSAALTSDDLMDVASKGGQLHLRAMSSRHDLTEAISDRIVERGDDETLEVLVGNDRAPLSRSASERVIDRALANPQLHEKVVGRASLPVDLLNQMYTVVEYRLREKIIARNAYAPREALEAALSGACARVAELQGGLPADYSQSVAYVDRLLEAGPIAALTLVSFAKGPSLTRLAVALSRACGVDTASVLRVLGRCDIDAFALTCRAAGYDDDLFTALVRHVMAAGFPTAAQIDSFNKLSPEVASRIVRFWKMRQAVEMPRAA